MGITPRIVTGVVVKYRSMRTGAFTLSTESFATTLVAIDITTSAKVFIYSSKLFFVNVL